MDAKKEALKKLMLKKANKNYKKRDEALQEEIELRGIGEDNVKEALLHRADDKAEANRLKRVNRLKSALKDAKSEGHRKRIREILDMLD